MRELRDLQTKQYTEKHTKDILAKERSEMYEEVTNLKGDNQNMQRTITKYKYHNNKEDTEKQRRKEMEGVQESISKLNELIEVNRALLEEETERNEDPHLLKKEKEVTFSL